LKRENLNWNANGKVTTGKQRKNFPTSSPTPKEICYRNPKQESKIPENAA
jgi:hypothetical protein